MNDYLRILIKIWASKDYRNMADQKAKNPLKEAKNEIINRYNTIPIDLIQAIVDENITYLEDSYQGQVCPLVFRPALLR